MRRRRDAEAELNLPPGFRFHPTDDELVAHYLRRKITCQRLPVPIIAEVDLYKYNPWELPDKALFGNKEWYFFTPRDRKYPNGSRPNRAAGNGYWKATGADKPVSAPGNCRPLGIKKALVFYHGKPPKGTKTDWIMHEYRLADTNLSAKRNSSLRLDDWVLCRLYNKKNELQMKTEEENLSVTPESANVENYDVVQEFEYSSPECAGKSVVQASSRGIQHKRSEGGSGMQIVERMKEGSDWFMDLKIDDLQNCLEGGGFDVLNQDYCFSAIESPTVVKWIAQMNMAPFCS